jgi:hypothetical protein
MNGIVLKALGLFFCLLSGVLVLSYLSWLSAGLSFACFIAGFFLIIYAFENNRVAK